MQRLRLCLRTALGVVLRQGLLGLAQFLRLLRQLLRLRTVRGELLLKSFGFTPQQPGHFSRQLFLCAPQIRRQFVGRVLVGLGHLPGQLVLALREVGHLCHLACILGCLCYVTSHLPEVIERLPRVFLHALRFGPALGKIIGERYGLGRLLGFLHMLFRDLAQRFSQAVERRALDLFGQFLDCGLRRGQLVCHFLEFLAAPRVNVLFLGNLVILVGGLLVRLLGMLPGVCKSLTHGFVLLVNALGQQGLGTTTNLDKDSLALAVLRPFAVVGQRVPYSNPGLDAVRRSKICGGQFKQGRTGPHLTLVLETLWSTQGYDFLLFWAQFKDELRRMDAEVLANDIAERNNVRRVDLELLGGRFGQLHDRHAVIQRLQTERGWVVGEAVPIRQLHPPRALRSLFEVELPRHFLCIFPQGLQQLVERPRQQEFLGLHRLVRGHGQGHLGSRHGRDALTRRRLFARGQPGVLRVVVPDGQVLDIGAVNGIHLVVRANGASGAHTVPERIRDRGNVKRETRHVVFGQAQERHTFVVLSPRRGRDLQFGTANASAAYAGLHP